MAVTDTQHTNTLGTRLTGVMNAVTGTLAAWNDSRATRKALGSLSDHELDDIGLSRGDIDKITR